MEKCKYRNHFFSPDENGTRSVIIEWSPPEQNFDKIYAKCPSSSMVTFEQPQLMSTMFIKCLVTNGQPFTTLLITDKSGYPWGILEVTDTPPSMKVFLLCKKHLSFV